MVSWVHFSPTTFALQTLPKKTSTLTSTKKSVWGW